MKRSYMLDLMNNTFKENYRGNTYQQVNKIILAKMEEAGMTPFTDCSASDIKDDEKYLTLHVDQAIYLGKCEWEPEDEN